jgi:hypothetical protein
MKIAQVGIRVKLTHFRKVSYSGEHYFGRQKVFNQRRATDARMPACINLLIHSNTITAGGSFDLNDARHYAVSN